MNSIHSLLWPARPAPLIQPPSTGQLTKPVCMTPITAQQLQIPERHPASAPHSTHLCPTHSGGTAAHCILDTLWNVLEANISIQEESIAEISTEINIMMNNIFSSPKEKLF